MRIGRRSALAAGMGTLLLALPACGGDTGSGAGSGSGSGAGNAAQDSGRTKTVTSTFTDEKVDVPAEPKRVVALWRTGGMLAELGVRPVAALEDELLESELGSKLYRKVEDVPTVGTWEGVDVEKLIEADPDLIIGMDNGSLGMQYDEISRIAPTVILKIKEPTDVWDNYPKVAEIVGKQANFEKRSQAVQDELAAVAEKYGDVLGDAAATSVRQTDGTIWVDTSKSLTHRRLAAAGFGYNPDYTSNPKRYIRELTAENLPNLSESKVLFYETALDGTVSLQNRKLRSMDSYERLPAAKADHVYPITSGTIYTFAAAERQVADLRKAAEDYAASR